MDSGASHYMTPNREAFFKYSMISLRTIEIVNGAEISGISLGKVRLSISVEGRTRSIILMDVLYVP
jgi:hypothetical protein